MAFKRKVDWVEARLRYEAGECQRSLAERYGVSTAAVCKHAKAEGWVQDLSQSVHQAAQAKTYGVTNPRDPEKTAKAIDEYGQKIPGIIENHQKEWSVIGSF